MLFLHLAALSTNFKPTQTLLPEESILRKDKSRHLLTPSHDTGALLPSMPVTTNNAERHAGDELSSEQHPDSSQAALHLPATVVSGIALDAGRLSGCVVCLDGASITRNQGALRPNGKCDPWEPQTVTPASGQYVITYPTQTVTYDVRAPTEGVAFEPDVLPPQAQINATWANLRVILVPGPDCIDSLSLTPVRAPLVCSFLTWISPGEFELQGKVCSPLTDLAYRTAVRLARANGAQADWRLTPYDATTSSFYTAAKRVAQALSLGNALSVTHFDPTSLDTFNTQNYEGIQIEIALRKLEVWEEQAAACVNWNRTAEPQESQA